MNCLSVPLDSFSEEECLPLVSRSNFSPKSKCKIWRSIQKKQNATWNARVSSELMGLLSFWGVYIEAGLESLLPGQDPPRTTGPRLRDPITLESFLLKSLVSERQRVHWPWEGWGCVPPSSLRLTPALGKPWLCSAFSRTDWQSFSTHSCSGNFRERNAESLPPFVLTESFICSLM